MANITRIEKLLAFLVVVTFTTIQASAQKVTVTGLVMDEEGQPVAGANVIDRAGKTGVITTPDGRYSINTEVNSTLDYSFIGMKTVTEKVAGRNVINVKLEMDAIGLEEVVAIGYGNIKKEEVTTAIARVSSDDFVKGGVASPLQLLQGKVAGLGMATTSGDPSAAPSITLRGISTLAASTSPLVVIDGVAGASINSVAPEDIESISVLKDGSAAAIYGTRGTNGVIIVTTRRPESGIARVSYSGYVKFDKLIDDENYLSADEYREKTKEFPGMQDFGGSTDWVDEITRKPVSHNHYLTISGGTDKTNYSASITYADKQGLYKPSFDKSLSAKVAISHSMFDDKLRISLNIHDKVLKKGLYPSEIYGQATLRNPTLPVYDKNGDYYETSNGENPVAAMNEYKGADKDNLLSLYGKVELRPVDGLTLSASGAYQNYYNEREWSGSHKTYAARYGSEFGSATLNGGHYDDRTLELQADYTRTFGYHSMTATAGYSYNKYVNQNWYMKAYNFPIDGFGAWNIGSAESTLDGLSTINSSKSERKLIGFYGRLNYNYHYRYLFMASIRREGSDKFGENNRWGWFPAVSAGWRISDEEFMKNIPWVNELKLRAGYGVTGTEPSASYQYIALYNFNSSYMSYSGGKWVNGIIPTNNPNPNLKWEEKHETNLGIDFSMLGNRLYGSVDAYYRHTKDLLYTYNVPTPPNISNNMLANVGSIMNKGIEIEVGGEIIKTKDISFTLSGNFSHNKNELLKLSNDNYELNYLTLGNLTHVQTYSHRLEEGWAIGNFYGWKTVGLKSQGTQWRIVGAENSTAGEEQKTILGNGIPKMFAGLKFNFRYKRVDLDVSFHGAFDYQILNQYRMMYETLAWISSYNLPKSAFRKVGEYYNYAPSTYCDRYVEDGDYVKLDNLTVGYNFNVTKVPYIKSTRIYVTAKNLFTITGYRGLDPEAVAITGLTPGIDSYLKFPTLRSITAGVDITF